jgi:hypothetical protein
MSEAPTADSAVEPGEATGATVQSTEQQADSTPEPVEAGQEQGDKSRINGLMSLAQKRTAERDEALAEVEALKAQLAGQGVEEAPVGLTQAELMYPDRYAQSDPGEADPMEQPEPPVIYAATNAARRPDQNRRSSPVPDSSTPAGRWAADKADIDAMHAQLQRAGREFIESQREQGLLD